MKYVAIIKTVARKYDLNGAILKQYQYSLPGREFVTRYALFRKSVQ